MIRSVFNQKNEKLIEKNQELLELASDERNEKIKEFVDQYNVLIPIAPIKGGTDGLHLIGTARAFVDIIDDEPHVRVSGGFQNLKEYHDTNKKHFKGTIVTHMHNQNLDYDKVVDGLLSGQKRFQSVTVAQLSSPKKNTTSGPEQGKFEEMKEGEENMTRHDAAADFAKDQNAQMKELQGTLKFKILKQRAPKAAGGGTGAAFEQDDDDVIISHLINPKLTVDYKDKNQKADCDGDMKDDDGNSIPFCAETFNLDVLEGKEDLAKYIHMSVTDRDEDVGKLKLKMQTLVNGGNTKSLEGLTKLKLIKQLEKEHINWYPLFTENNQSPGSLQIQSKFIPDERWKAKVLNNDDSKDVLKCCLITTGITAAVVGAGAGGYAYIYS